MGLPPRFANRKSGEENAVGAQQAKAVGNNLRGLNDVFQHLVANDHIEMTVRKISTSVFDQDDTLVRRRKYLGAPNIEVAAQP